MQQQTAMVCTNPGYAPFWPTEDDTNYIQCRSLEQNPADEIDNSLSPHTPGLDRSLSASNNSSSHSATPTAPSPSTDTPELHLRGSYIDLSHLGSQEGRFVLDVAQSVFQSVSFILDTFAEDNITRPVFISSYKTRTDHRASGQARSIVQSFMAIFENLANTLHTSFDNDGPLISRFPHIRSWMSDSAHPGEVASTTQREWRNSCAHRAFISAPFVHQSTSEMRCRPFLPGDFYDALQLWLPSLRAELEDLIAILDHDADTFPAKDYSVHVDADLSMARMNENEEHAQTLVAEGNCEILPLHNLELKAVETATRYATQRDKYAVERDRYDRLVEEFENEASEYRERKSRLAGEIWACEEQAGSGWDQVAEGNGEQAGSGWDQVAAEQSAERDGIQAGLLQRDAEQSGTLWWSTTWLKCCLPWLDRQNEE
jgi:hypothetical protein